MSRSLAEIMLDDTMPQFASVTMPFGTTLTGLDNWISDHYQHCTRARLGPNAEVIIHDPDLTEEETEQYINQHFSKIYFYERNDKEDYQQGEDEHVATAKIFISPSGSWLLKQYDALSTSTLAHYEFAIFIERADQDIVSESVLRIKLGKGLIPKLVADANGDEKMDTTGPEKVTVVLTSQVFQTSAYPLSTEQIETIIGKCYVPDDILKYIIRFFFGRTIDTSQLFLTGLASATSYLSKKCFEHLRIDEATWNIRYGDSLPQNLFQPLLSAIDDAVNTLTEAKQNPLVTVFPHAEATIDYLLYAAEQWHDVISGIMEATAEAFAIFCGIWNGFIDLIGGVLQLISWIAELDNQALFALLDPSLSQQLFKEYFDEILQAVSKIDWEAVKKSAENAYNIFQFKMAFIYPYAIEKKLKSLNDTEIMYFCGYALFELAQWIIPPLKFAKLSKLKALNVAEDVVDRLQDGASRHLQRPVHNGPDMPPSVAAAGFTAYIDELLKLLRSGTKAVAKEVEEFIQSIIKWIDEVLSAAKKQLDDLTEALYDDFETDELFRKIKRKKWFDAEEYLNVQQLKSLAIELRKNFGIDLKVVSRKSSDTKALWKKMALGETSEGNRVLAFFRPEKGFSRKYGEELNGPFMYVLDNVSAYTVAHELEHARLWYKMVKKNPELAELYKTLPRRVHEEFVLSQLVKEGKWPIDELMKDLDTVNGMRRGAGLQEQNLDFFKKWKLEDNLN